MIITRITLERNMSECAHTVTATEIEYDEKSN